MEYSTSGLPYVSRVENTAELEIERRRVAVPPGIMYQRV